ncbi:MAG: hypothetical protein ABSF98_20890 [Bryobacteraceae bacterium]|jgi:hypothetical protein
MVARLARSAGPVVAAVFLSFALCVFAANPPANIARTGGDNQSANIGVQFGAVIEVTVTDSASSPVSAPP